MVTSILAMLVKRALERLRGALLPIVLCSGAVKIS